MHPAPRKLPTLRFLLLGGLLVAEIWALREWYTTDVLLDQPGALARLIRLARYNAPWGMAVVAAIGLLAGKGLRHELERLAPRVAPPRRLVAPVAAHFLAFGGFAWLTGRLLAEGTGEVDPFSFAAWLVLGAAVLLFWAWIAYPPGALWELARRNLGILAGGLVLGTAAVWLGRLLVAGDLWKPLARGTLWLAHALLSLVLPDVYYEPHEFVLGPEGFRVLLTRECSGYEGISLFVVFFAAFVSLSRARLRFPNVFLLLPLGIGFVWAVNGVRVALLILIGTFVSEELAMGGFHSYIGWLLFSVTALSSVALGTRLSFFSRDRRDEERRADDAPTVNPAAVFLGPLLAVVACVMVAGASSTTPERWYPLRVVAAACVLWVYRREYRALLARPSRAAFGIGALVYVLWTALHYLLPRGGGDPLADVRDLPLAVLMGWAAFRVAGSIVIAPVAEELAFRGFLQRRLIAADFEAVSQRRFTWISFLIPTLLFGALHASWIAGSAAGALYALAAYRRGRLADAVAAHGTTNVLLAVHAVVTRDWYLWL